MWGGLHNSIEDSKDGIHGRNFSMLLGAAKKKLDSTKSPPHPDSARCLFTSCIVAGHLSGQSPHPTQRSPAPPIPALSSLSQLSPHPQS